MFTINQFHQTLTGHLWALTGQLMALTGQLGAQMGQLGAQMGQLGTPSWPVRAPELACMCPKIVEENMFYRPHIFFSKLIHQGQINNEHVLVKNEKKLCNSPFPRLSSFIHVF